MPPASIRPRPRTVFVDGHQPVVTTRPWERPITRLSPEDCQAQEETAGLMRRPATAWCFLAAPEQLATVRGRTRKPHQKA